MGLEPISAASGFLPSLFIKLQVNLWVGRGALKNVINFSKGIEDNHHGTTNVGPMLILNSETLKKKFCVSTWCLFYGYISPQYKIFKNIYFLKLGVELMKMVGKAVNWNVFSFLTKSEQTAPSHMLTDHAASAMHNLDFSSWCEE